MRALWLWPDARWNGGGLGGARARALYVGTYVRTGTYWAWGLDLYGTGNTAIGHTVSASRRIWDRERDLCYIGGLHL